MEQSPFSPTRAKVVAGLIVMLLWYGFHYQLASHVTEQLDCTQSVECAGMQLIPLNGCQCRTADDLLGDALLLFIIPFVTTYAFMSVYELKHARFMEAQKAAKEKQLAQENAQNATAPDALSTEEKVIEQKK